jgi:hypothetical protein
VRVKARTIGCRVRLLPVGVEIAILKNGSDLYDRILSTSEEALEFSAEEETIGRQKKKPYSTG